MKQHDFDIHTGAGLSDYQFDSRKEAISWLRRKGFNNATYRSNMHGGNKLYKKIRKIFKSYTVMRHTNGTIAYVGYHDVKTSNGPQEVLWVRVVGKNELN